MSFGHIGNFRTRIADSRARGRSFRYRRFATPHRHRMSRSRGKALSWTSRRPGLTGPLSDASATEPAPEQSARTVLDVSGGRVAVVDWCDLLGGGSGVLPTGTVRFCSPTSRRRHLAGRPTPRRWEPTWRPMTRCCDRRSPGTSARLQDTGDGVCASFESATRAARFNGGLKKSSPRRCATPVAMPIRTGSRNRRCAPAGRADHVCQPQR